MSAIENDSVPVIKPIVLGTPCELDAAAQLQVVIWALKTSIVFDAHRIFGPNVPTTMRSFFLQAERDVFYQGMQKGSFQNPVLRDTVVWLSGLVSPQTSIFCETVILRGTVNVERTQAPLISHVTTIAAGFFVVQIVNSRGELPPGAVGSVKLTGRPQRDFSDAARQLSPPIAMSVSWPPRRLLDLEALREFSNRWSDAIWDPGERFGPYRRRRLS
jgi:hypothetical protein